MRGAGYCPPRIDQDRAKAAVLCTCNVLPWIIPNEYRISSIDIKKRQCVLENLRRRFPPADVDAEDGGIHGLREAVPSKLLRPSFARAAPWRVGNDCRPDSLPAYCCKRRERMGVQRTKAEDRPEEDVHIAPRSELRVLLGNTRLVDLQEDERDEQDPRCSIRGHVGTLYRGRRQLTYALRGSRISRL